MCVHTVLKSKLMWKSGSSNSIEVPLAESSCLSERATAGAELTSAA